TIEEVCTSPVSLLDSVLMTPNFVAYLFGYLHIIECIIFKATTLHLVPHRTARAHLRLAVSANRNGR
ncbi:hypothetical protein CSUI_008132, partial [Cystoisospora suis]